ncbi:unnamed protein product [Caenorhabditis sp. 36 PRJEB53466]|nr:unnamed protein product [Caenorhabditis sp. 36 PRJEB53466]
MEPNPKKRRVLDEEQAQECTSSILSLPTSLSSTSEPSSSSSNVVDMVDLSTSPLPEPLQPAAAPANQVDNRLRELLLSSPAHLFGIGTPGAPNPQNVTTSWEQWLCFLATNLSPAQWQGYWLAHCALFGEQAVPVHLLSFFQGQSSPAQPPNTGPHPNDPIHARYGTAFLKYGHIHAGYKFK